MTNTTIKTFPRLLICISMLAGAVFMGMIAKLLYPPVIKIVNKPVIENIDIIFLVHFAFFAVVSAICFYFFLTTKTIWLTETNLIINYQFLPYKKAYDLNEIHSITQKSKIADAAIMTFNKWYIFTDHKTSIKLSNGKVINTNSLVQSEYENLQSNLRKLKSGQSGLKQEKGRLQKYLFDNLDGLIFLIILLALTIGLSYNVLKK